MNINDKLKIETANGAKPVLYTVVVTEADMKALIRIRNYFGENDKTQLEHLAYDVLDRVINQLGYSDITGNRNRR